MLDRLNAGAWLRACLAGLAITLASYFAISKLPAFNVGDGSEYYAMQLAALDTSRPYMTEAAWGSYEALVNSGDVMGLEPTQRLRNKFPALRVGETADFNHFWAYSAAAAAAGKLGLGPHNAFLLLHSLVLALVLVGGYRLRGWPGALAIGFIAFASPSLWFVNKVHGEAVTVALSTLAVAAIWSRRYAAAALLLAVVSTQNISFALPAAGCAVAALIGIWRNGKASTAEVLCLSMTPLFAALHPAYYFFRYGVLTPQLLAGGAELKGNFLTSLNFLLDPNVGLLPNWPAGIALTLLGIFYMVRERRHWRSVLGPMLLLVLFAAAAMFAQAATQNVNSGATPGLSRYGLWYLCLFYPVLLTFFSRASTSIGSINSLGAAVLGAAAIILFVVNLRAYRPNHPQEYLHPSRLSRFVEYRLPWLFNSNQEVFFERYSGRGEVVPPRPSVVLGPGCRKALYLGPDADSGAAPVVLGESRCGLDARKLGAFVAHKLAEDGAATSGYVLLKEADLAALRQDALRGSVYPGAQGTTLRDLVGQGWGEDEAWGIWSIAPVAELRFRVADTSKPLLVRITHIAFFGGSHQSLRVTPRVNGKEQPAVDVNPGSIPGTLEIQVPAQALAESGGVVDLDLLLDSPVSPASVGLSTDGRALGLGLKTIELR